MSLKTIAFVVIALFAASVIPVQAQDSRPIYVSMLPHFVVNLGSSQYMRVKAQVLVKDIETEAAMKLHMPAIRHDLLLLLSDLSPGQLSSAEGKERLSTDAMATVRKTLTRLKAPSEVGGFFITDLVVQ